MTDDQTDRPEEPAEEVEPDATRPVEKSGKPTTPAEISGVWKREPEPD
jgi:hypothetical protein